MKKRLLFFIIILTSLYNFSQSIIVDQATYTVDQIVTDVLINSPCANVSNITYSTGTNFGSTNGIGYFEEPTGNFYFGEGLLLTTGNAANAVGPEDETLNDGSTDWPGDNDLENALVSLLPGDTHNATFVEFDFVPAADRISFNFIFASEEYGQFQCTYTDAFAFLLTEVSTGITTNLAVVPGTADPVSVLSIRDAIYNNNCQSVNPEFFDEYFGASPGTDPSLSPTDFRGLTKTMVATSNVTPNAQYHIKLVIADDEDEQFDAAVFIEAGSFNLGVDLGQDLTILDGNSACTVDTLILDTGIPTTLGTHTWYLNNVEILGETGSSLEVAADGDYSVLVEFSSNCTATDNIIVEFTTSPVLNPISDQLICDDNNDGFWVLDLNTIAATVLGTQNTTEYSVTFHLSQQDADDNVSAIISPYTNATAYQEEEIFIRIENNTGTNCYMTDSFIFDVFNQPTADVQIYDVCDNADDGDDTNGFYEFDLAFLTDQVLGTQNPAEFNVSYHISLADASTGASPLTMLFTNTTANLQQIIARVENVDNTSCYETSTIDLIVYELPNALTLVELFQCDDDTDGFTEFNLIEANELISANYLNETFTFHTSLVDAENNISAIANPTVYVNTDSSAAPDILYVRTESADGCFRVSQLNLLVSTTQIPSTFQLTYNLCDNDIIDGDYSNGIVTFDLTDANTQITNLFPIGQAITITYYENLEDALAESNFITDIANHRNDASPNVQTIFVRVDSDVDNSCLGLGEHITLTVNPLPDEIAVPDLIECEVGTDGYYAFDLESKTDEILNGQSPTQFAVTYHATLADAQSGIGALVSPYTNTTINSQQIYVNITDTATGCDISTVSFNIEVQEGAVATMPLNEYVICDNVGDNDGFGQFDLTTQDAEILGTQASTAYTVSYYETSADAEAGVSQISTLYENIMNPQVVYARVDNNTTICYQTTTLTLRVDLLPIFNIEDSYILCVDSANGVVTTVLPPVIDTGLGTANYSFSWTELGDPTTVLSTDSTFIPSMAGTYTVTVTNTATGCENKDSTEVIESSPPDVAATVSTLAFADEHIIVATATGNGEYEFSLDGGPWVTNNPNTGSYTFTDVIPGEHTITARDINGCGSSSDTVLIMDYPLYFTPNGDGIHETWNIVGISSQFDAKIYIFDRYGKLLKQLSPTGEGWNGSYNGDPLPPSDYWFVVEYREPRDDVRKEFKAHFTLKK